MRRKAMRPPDRLHCQNGKPDRLGHSARSPVGRLVRRSHLRQADNLCHTLGGHRCPAGRTGLVAQQAIDAFVHEAFLPTPHAGLRLARRCHIGRSAKTIAAEQHDAGSPNMLLQAQRCRRYVAQSLAVGFGQGESDTIVNPTRLARQNTNGNPQSDSLVPVNPLAAARRSCHIALTEPSPPTGYAHMVLRLKNWAIARSRPLGQCLDPCVRPRLCLKAQRG